MNATQKRLLGAGVLLLVVTNAVALIGVAYNRTGTPDRILTLTEREITAQSGWIGQKEENSGLSVELLLRTEAAPETRLGENDGWGRFSLNMGFGSATRWLDRDKLAALGFDVAAPADGPEGARHYDHMLERDVLLVLELDGPTRNRALQDTRDRVADLERKATDGPEDKTAAQRLKNARENLRWEENVDSRLFIIDAGLDEDSLRQKYPDQTHYAIVRGTVRPQVVYAGNLSKLYGRVSAVHCENIHVPLQFRGVITAADLVRARIRAMPASAKKALSVQVAFGKRLEPWIMAARLGTP